MCSSTYKTTNAITKAIKMDGVFNSHGRMNHGMDGKIAQNLFSEIYNNRRHFPLWRIKIYAHQNSFIKALIKGISHQKKYFYMRVCPPP
jgi:hypothetical protein